MLMDVQGRTWVLVNVHRLWAVQFYNIKLFGSPWMRPFISPMSFNTRMPRKSTFVAGAHGLQYYHSYPISATGYCVFTRITHCTHSPCLILLLFDPSVVESSKSISAVNTAGVGPQAEETCRWQMRVGGHFGVCACECVHGLWGSTGITMHTARNGLPPRRGVGFAENIPVGRNWSIEVFRFACLRAIP